MKRRFLNIFLFLLALFLMPLGSSYAQTLAFSSTEKQKFEDGKNFLENEFIAKDNYFCCEDFKVGELVITSLNRRNKEIWKRNICAPNSFLNLESIKKDSKRNVYVLGTFLDKLSLLSGFYLIKINKRGRVLWFKSFKLSEELLAKNSINTIYINSHSELTLINKSFLKNTEKQFSQISVLKFNKKGDGILEASAIITDQIVGSIVDNKEKLFFLGSDVVDNEISVNFLVSLDDVLDKIKAVDNNRFQVESSEFSSSLKLTDTLEVSEIDFYSDVVEREGLKFVYAPESSSILLKCKIINNNKTNTNSFQSFGPSVEGNQWKLDKEDDYINESEFVLQVKRIKKKNNEFAYPSSEKEKIQKIKSEIYTIQSLSNEMYSTVLVKMHFLNIPELFENKN